MRKNTPDLRCPAAALLVAVAVLALPASACSDEDGTSGSSTDVGGTPTPDIPVSSTDTGGPATDAGVPSDDATVDPCKGCLPDQTCVDDQCVSPEPGGCEPGVIAGCATNDSQSVCDATGTAFVAVPCPAMTAALS